MMNHARLSVGLQGVSMAERAYQQARSYAGERVQGRPLGRAERAAPIIQHPDVQRMLLTMKAQAEAARSLAYVTAAHLDAARQHPDESIRHQHQRLVDLLTPVVKAWCTDGGISNADMAIQVTSRRAAFRSSTATRALRPSTRAATASRR